MLCRFSSGIGNTPSGSRGREGSMVSGLIWWRRSGVSRIDSSDLRRRRVSGAGSPAGGGSRREPAGPAWTCAPRAWRSCPPGRPRSGPCRSEGEDELSSPFCCRLEVGPIGPGLLLDPVVLLGQELGVRRRLLLLVDLEVDALFVGLVGLRLRGRGRRRLLGRRLGLLLRLGRAARARGGGRAPPSSLPAWRGDSMGGRIGGQIGRVRPPRRSALPPGPAGPPPGRPG